MNLQEAILSVLPTDSSLDVSSVIRKTEAETVFTRDSYNANDFVDALADLAKSGRIAHTMPHSMSLYRRRTDREYAELMAVKDAKQAELL